MAYEIQPSSAEVVEADAITPVKSDVSRARQSYPFAKLGEGQSFAVPIDEANLKSLRTRCSQLSVQGKRYVVHVHSGVGLVEVARLVDAVATQPKIYQTGDALHAKNQANNVGNTEQDFYAPGFNPATYDWNSQS